MHRVFCGELITDGVNFGPKALLIDGGKIVAHEEYSPGVRVDSPDIDLTSHAVLPGMIDIHVHGGGGRDLMEGTVEVIEFMSRRLANCGVTSFLSTPLTAPLGAIATCCAAAEDATKGDLPGARLMGLHLEGPYINLKYKGAQPPEFIRAPDASEFEETFGRWLDLIKVVTLAPEVEGGFDLVKFLSNQGVVASVGHTNATFDEVSRAIDMGARHATHCFCAMRPMHHRDPGTVGAVLARAELKAELIWDNVHVVEPIAKILCQIKGASGVICVSDGTTGAGMPEGYRFELWGHGAIVKNGAARLEEDESTLAGSAIGMDACLRNAESALGLEAASLLCCANPAESLGLQGKLGTLAVGAEADLFGWSRKSRSIVETYIAGRRISA